MEITIDREKCTLCILCVEYCPTYVFELKDGKILADGSKCIECYACIPLCPANAIKILE